jgi:UDP-glucose:(heptosyl)LPS alpha-1,3-glucosyltransferase
MKVACVLYRWFPHGGLQRDCLAIARKLAARGHGVEIFCGAWEGQATPDDIAVRVIGWSGLTNHGRNRRFVAAVTKLLAQGGYDRVVGFDRMPGLDFYYAADRCFMADVHARRGAWFRLTPRYRTAIAFERAVFGPQSRTHALVLHDGAKRDYQACYHTPDARMHVLPPAIGRDRARPHDAAAIRTALRAELAVGENEFLLLLVASRYRTKGLDRAIRMLASLPERLRPLTTLVVVGGDQAQAYSALAAQLGVAGRIRIMGGRDDVVRFLCASDLLVHPARADNTGTVLLEAILCGLPVMAASVCGFAPHVERAGAGLVLPDPYVQEAWNAALPALLDPTRLAQHAQAALAYAGKTDLYGGHDHAVKLIESLPVR